MAMTVVRRIRLGISLVKAQPELCWGKLRDAECTAYGWIVASDTQEAEQI
jgi:hypothetical protein